MPVSWRPKRYPIMGTSASQIARLVEVRRKERVVKASLGMVLILFFVILGIVVITQH